MPSLAIVTGGNSGIGFQVARKLCSQYQSKGLDNVVLITCRDAETGRDAVKLLECEYGVGCAQTYCLDVTEPDSAKELAKTVKAEFGYVDILVNNAGVMSEEWEFPPYSQELVTRVMETNVTGVMRCVEAFMPLMKPHGRIVNVAPSYALVMWRYLSDANRMKLTQPDLTVGGLSRLIDEVSIHLQKNSTEAYGWCGSLYPMSKLFVLVLTRVLGDARSRAMPDSDIYILAACLDDCCTRGTEFRTDAADPAHGAEDVMKVINRQMRANEQGFLIVGDEAMTLEAEVTEFAQLKKYYEIREARLAKRHASMTSKEPMGDDSGETFRPSSHNFKEANLAMTKESESAEQPVKATLAHEEATDRESVQETDAKLTTGADVNESSKAEEHQTRKEATTTSGLNQPSTASVPAQGSPAAATLTMSEGGGVTHSTGQLDEAVASGQCAAGVTISQRGAADECSCADGEENSSAAGKSTMQGGAPEFGGVSAGGEAEKSALSSRPASTENVEPNSDKQGVAKYGVALKADLTSGLKDTKLLSNHHSESGSSSLVKNGSSVYIAAAESPSFAKRCLDLQVDEAFNLSIELPKDGLLIKLLYITVDQSMRRRMCASHKQAFEVGKPITGHGLAEVIKSNNKTYEAGDYLIGMLPWSTYAVYIPTEKDHSKRLPSSYHLPLIHSVGLLGMAGWTAWLSLTHMCRPAAGETLLVLDASGAIGQVLGQLAKLKGLRVVGMACSDTEVEYLTSELQFDDAFNSECVKSYDELVEKLRALCPEGIDCTVGNVGGHVLDAVLAVCNRKARISVYEGAADAEEGGEVYRMKNLDSALAKEAKIEGFTVSSLTEVYGVDDAVAEMTELLKDGKLKYRHEILDRSMANLPHVLVEAFEGTELGYKIVKILDE